MTVKLNHTIVAARDRKASALFVSELLGLAPPVLLGPFALVTVGAEIKPQPYAFPNSEAEFDSRTAKADPHRPCQYSAGIALVSSVSKGLAMSKRRRRSMPVCSKIALMAG